MFHSTFLVLHCSDTFDSPRSSLHPTLSYRYVNPTTICSDGSSIPFNIYTSLPFIPLSDLSISSSGLPITCIESSVLCRPPSAQSSTHSALGPATFHLTFTSPPDLSNSTTYLSILLGQLIVFMVDFPVSFHDRTIHLRAKT